LCEIACELDLHNEDDEMAALAEEDDAFLAFRRGLRDLRERSMPLTEAMEHVERRIEKAYQEAFGKPLPPVSDFPGTRLCF
jgi:hypothetical protein